MIVEKDIDNNKSDDEKESIKSDDEKEKNIKWM